MVTNQIPLEDVLSPERRQLPINVRRKKKWGGSDPPSREYSMIRCFDFYREASEPKVDHANELTKQIENTATRIKYS